METYNEQKAQQLASLKKEYGAGGHIPQVCAIDGCSTEASYWIEDCGIGFNGAIDGTIYLCDDHGPEIQDDDDGMVHLINPKNMEAITTELAGYACDDDCEMCNA
jgi:hypothetical protein